MAISDENGEFAFPKGIVSTSDAVAEIAALCEKEQVGGIVIGKSVASNGMENEIVGQAEAFGKKLSIGLSLPIFFQEESFSTVEAHRYQVSAGKRDDSAAAIILQRFLDINKTK
ncbi:MAG: putative pre6S rRNA nuclease [Candidatus Nomurabacteria bacterium]|nr:putative pre6S rRNA nuclease [Candidatus Nomurabacteria bacterium]